MGTRFTGDWNGVGKIADRAERNETRLNRNLSRLAATEYLQTVREAIDTHIAPGGMGIWRLSLDWIKRKNSNFAWFGSGWFKDHLSIEQVDENGTLFAGASAKRPYNDKLSMADVAKFGEYGTRREGAKALFGPARVITFRRIEGKLVQHVERALKTDNYGSESR